MAFQIRFRSWKSRRQATIQSMRELADKIERLQKTMDYIKLVGTTTTAVSSLGSLGYILTSPLKSGVSLAGLASIGLVGGCLNLGALAGTYFNEKELLEKARKILNSDQRECEILRAINPDTSDEVRLFRNFELGASADAALPTPKKPTFAVPLGSIVIRAVIANPVGYSMSFSTKNEHAESSPRSTDTIENIISSTAAMILLPIDIYEFMRALMEISSGFTNTSAKTLRRIAGDLENELRHNERLEREQMD